MKQRTIKPYHSLKRIKDLEQKLAIAVEALEACLLTRVCHSSRVKAVENALEKIKGESDE